MGTACSRRRDPSVTAQLHRTSRPGLDDLQEESDSDWSCVEIPPATARDSPQTPIANRHPGRQLAGPRFSRPHRLWLCAVLRIRILSVFRRRWSTLGSWVNLHKNGDGPQTPSEVPAETLARAGRLWSRTTREILITYKSQDLFGHIRKQSRLKRAEERIAFKAIAASLRAQLART